MALKRKGISLLTDETAKKKYVQIDLEMLLKEPEAVEVYLDGLIAESRRNEHSEDHDAIVRKIKGARRK